MQGQYGGGAGEAEGKIKGLPPMKPASGVCTSFSVEAQEQDAGACASTMVPERP